MVGTATSAVTHRGISGASVTVYGVGTVTTDQYGDYRIAGLAPSTVYSVVCSAPGFSTQDAQVSSDSAGNAWLDIQLMPTVPGSQTSP
jgi:hypothetical protein